MRRLRTFSADLVVDNEERALLTAKKKNARTRRVDGPRLDDGIVGAAVVWWGGTQMEQRDGPYGTRMVQLGEMCIIVLCILSAI